MMNGTDSLVQDVTDVASFFPNRITECLLCNGYYGFNHDQPLCRTCHLFLFPSFLSFYSKNIRKPESCDSGNEDSDSSHMPDNNNMPFNSVEQLNSELEKRLDELSSSQPPCTTNHSILCLPDEVLINLFKYLDDLSLWNVRRVCSRWKRIVDNEFTEAQWRSFVEHRWPLFHSCQKCICWKSTYSKLFESSSCLYCLQNQIISDNLSVTKKCTWRYIRLQNEMKNSCADPPDGINALPLDPCLFNWQASIAGPGGSPYEGGLFFLHLQILPDYPLRPPLVHFTTKIFHPNVSRHGDIGLDSINENWSLALTITKILISIQSLLTDPYSYVCMEPSIGKLYQQNRSLYEKIARYWTQKYAVYNAVS